ncbi:uncharacterized protein ARMOST_17814 [Armillaria ostoyae]|uniref:Uncharacterized protein n=1 Tax=Armillaria ostoyae TaxID=47428 RepID=A0A284S014_ARMOS|nr:uncharacterized protein ARMOST_17814 [Armillaria ostoyae]
MMRMVGPSRQKARARSGVRDPDLELRSRIVGVGWTLCDVSLIPGLGKLLLSCILINRPGANDSVLATDEKHELLGRGKTLPV